MKTKFTLFSFALVLCVNINTAYAQINKQDSLALVDLYNSTNGAHWKNHTNWLTANPVSTWDGISVTRKRVTRILLYNNRLNGNIPSSIGDLTDLQELDLSHNQLYDSIPSSIGNLINLQELLLFYNQLSGSIPSSIGNLVSLTVLHLVNNKLSAVFPFLLDTLQIFNSCGWTTTN